MLLACDGRLRVCHLAADTRRENWMGRFLTIAALLLSTSAQATEQCTKAVATETPCAGVVMPRDWALECAARKNRATVPPSAPVVEKPLMPWYLVLTAGLVIGWGISELRR
jgi:hypothetical protein